MLILYGIFFIEGTVHIMNHIFLIQLCMLITNLMFCFLVMDTVAFVVHFCFLVMDTVAFVVHFCHLQLQVSALCGNMPMDNILRINKFLCAAALIIYLVVLSDTSINGFFLWSTKKNSSYFFFFL